VLSGKVTMLVGADNVRLDLSSWSVLGSSALESNGKHQYAPDYSAYVSTGPCRCIQIKQDAFVDLSATSAFERKISLGDNKVIAGNMLAARASLVEDGDSRMSLATDHMSISHRSVLGILSNDTLDPIIETSQKM
jgi:hypothetical protein